LHFLKPVSLLPSKKPNVIEEIPLFKHLFLFVALTLALSACGKAEKEKQETQLKMQADKARIELQDKADALARNPPPELIKAAKEQAAAEAAKTGK
jgi:hypothetical protein